LNQSETILEIIPKNSLHFEYIETLKMNFDQLIYNCGGVLGIWFGLSIVKILDIFVDFLGSIHFTLYLIPLKNMIVNSTLELIRTINRILVDIVKFFTEVELYS